MIELFSKTPHYFERNRCFRFTSIHINDSIASLSAILLNDEYYDLLVNGKTVIDGYSVIDMETIILFKIRAWLDLKCQKENGKDIDSSKITKHKNDIFRLLSNIILTKKIVVNDNVKNDINLFIEKVKEDKPDLRNIGIIRFSFDDMIQLLYKLFIG